MSHRYSFLILFLVAILPLAGARTSSSSPHPSEISTNEIANRAPAQAVAPAIPDAIVMSQIIESNQSIKASRPTRGIAPLVVESLEPISPATPAN